MKNLIANILVLIISATFTLLTIEQAYRFYLFDIASLSIEKMNSLHNMGESGLITPSLHNEIIFELKPNLDTYFKLTQFKTNSQGLRDKEYNVSKLNDVYRIAVVGDSFTMPAGVEINKSYHSRLEEQLNKEQPEEYYQFINFGVGGYSLRQYLAIIKFKVKKYNPDLIIVGFCGENDHVVYPDKIFKEPYKVKSTKNSFYRSFVLDKLRNIINNNSPSINLVDFTENEKKYMTGIFSEMKAFSIETHTPIIIVYLNTRYNQRYVDNLEKLVIDKGLKFLNASSPFATKDMSDYMIYPTDSHPNLDANKIFAEELYQYLTQFIEKNNISR